MAFPSSPANGQMYNNYVYDASTQTWVKSFKGSFSVGITAKEMASGVITGYTSEGSYHIHDGLVHVAGNLHLTGSGTVTEGDSVNILGLPYVPKRMNNQHRSLGVVNFYSVHDGNDNAICDALVLENSNYIESEVITVQGNPAWNGLKISFNFTYEPE